MKKTCSVCKNYRYVIYGDKPVNCFECNFNGEYKLKEIDICIYCGKPSPCKRNCSYSTIKSLVKQD